MIPLLGSERGLSARAGGAFSNDVTLVSNNGLVVGWAGIHDEFSITTVGEGAATRSATPKRLARLFGNAHCCILVPTDGCGLKRSTSSRQVPLEFLVGGRL